MYYVVKYLVTGAAGFIGSKTVEQLAEDGHFVFAMDDFSLGIADNVHGDAELIEGSVREANIPDGIDGIFHYAAHSSLQWCEENPVRAADVNVSGTVRIFEYAKDNSVPVAWSSTSSIYGTHHEPASEEDALDIVTAYDATKRSGENFAEYYREYHDASIATLRPYSVYGGSQDENHKREYANIITGFANTMASGNSPVLFGDGKQSRDFVHVDDVVRAFRATLNNSGTYNVGTGKPVTFNTIVELLNKELGTKLEPEYKENPFPEKAYVRGQNADISKLTTETSWEPQVSIEEGVRRVCDQLE